ncbi:hypothetical protein F5Y15DRAFT_425415 [Xylariaceae sp. FL0016]|nr:hypothetical protein F5Y15DRAFT_425415 [Xylariaceae sp. FL0016]
MRVFCFGVTIQASIPQCPGGWEETAELLAQNLRFRGVDNDIASHRGEMPNKRTTTDYSYWEISKETEINKDMTKVGVQLKSRVFKFSERTRWAKGITFVWDVLNGMKATVNPSAPLEPFRNLVLACLFFEGAIDQIVPAHRLANLGSNRQNRKLGDKTMRKIFGMLLPILPYASQGEKMEGEESGSEVDDKAEPTKLPPQLAQLLCPHADPNPARSSDGTDKGYKITVSDRTIKFCQFPGGKDAQETLDWVPFACALAQMAGDPGFDQGQILYLGQNTGNLGTLMSFVENPVKASGDLDAF